MNIIFCGGGTAGHITPALAIAQEIKRSIKNSRILFIGREGGNENELISKAGFPYATLTLKGLKRKLTLKNLDVLHKAIVAKKEAKRIIKAFSPDVILGTGGYVCWPVIKAGYEMKIPVFIHESNIYPGLTTRLLANKCQKIFLYTEETKNYLPKKANSCVVGNPTNKEFFEIKRSDARAKMGLSSKYIFLLSYGGSLGAEKINDIMISTMQNYSSKELRICHIHATGKKNYKPEYNNMFTQNSRCKIVPFIYNMPQSLNAADIVICRAGAMTIAELAAAKSTAILIPSPNVADDHQLKNANALCEKHAAILVREDELNEAIIKSKIAHLVSNCEERKRMSKCIEIFAKRDVEKIILSELSSALK